MRVIASLLIAFSLSPVIQGGQMSSELSGALSWRLIGPFRGGRAVAVSGVEGGGSTFFFGSVDGGVWKSTDAGVVWTPIFNGQQVASIGALAVAPSNSQIIYAGTGESDIRSDLASGDGVYKTEDGGRTWKNVGLADTRQISRIAVDRRNPNLVLVAALGHAYGPNPERGVFRSSDGGATWHKVLYRGPQVGAADLAMASDSPSVVFATMWQAQRPPWSTYAPLGGSASGLYRSQDGGETWSELTGHGLPQGPWGRSGVAIAAGTQGRRVYAVIDAKDAGLYRSDDGGDSWIRVNQDPRVTSRAWYFSSITVDPNDPDVVYAPNVALFKLANGGKTLSIVRGAPGGDDYHQLWIDPANSSHMLLGTDQGTTVTLNGGQTWSSWYNQPTAQFYHVAANNSIPYQVFGAQQDSGAAGTVTRTNHGEIDARDWFTASGSESGYIAPDSSNPDVLFASGTYGTVVRFDRRLMQSQNIAPSLLPGFGTAINERKYRDPWTPVLVFSPAQPNALYLGTQYVMRTVDQGLHWQTISPDLTGAKPQSKDRSSAKVSVDNAREKGYGVVYTIAPSPLKAAEIWAGSDTGLIHLTRDGGGKWADVTPPNLSPWSKITQVEASHFHPAEAYAAVDRHRLDDRHPYLFRTRDFGKTWQPIVSGIGDHDFLRAIREDPKRAGLLFAGTEFALYVSFDDGDSWQSLQLNLPVTSVRDLAIHDNDLIVATHGRAFWVMDDISSLRQMNGQAAPASALLYKPATALRTTSDSFAGTPLPPEEPQAKNPPRGAVIDYYLPAGAAGAVEIEFADAHGQIIGHYSSRAKTPEAAQGLAIAPRWLTATQPLSETEGMHRFVWNLRFGPAGEQTTADDQDTGLQTAVGPLVLPGHYTVKLRTGGKEQQQNLTVIMDPRSRATAAVLAEQFQWAQLNFDDMLKARVAASEVRGLRKQLAQLETRTANEAALSKDLTVADSAAQTLQTGQPNDQSTGLNAVNRAFSIDLNAIESADRPPTGEQIALYHQSHQKLAACLATWTKLRDVTVPALNKRLTADGLSQIVTMRLPEESHAGLSQ